jgi:hypothetical protein
MKLSLICASLENPTFFVKSLEKPFLDLNPLLQEKFLNDFEIIIVQPREFYAETFESLFNITKVADRKLGIYEAFTVGVSAARGEFIIIVNTDDTVNVHELLLILEKYVGSDAVAIYGDTFIHDDTSDNIIHAPGSLLPDTIKSARMPGSHQAQMIQKSEYVRLNYFKTYEKLLMFPFKLKFASDLDFYARSFKSGGKWIYEPELVAIQRLGGSTSTHWLRTTVEILLVTWIQGPKNLKQFTYCLRWLIGASRFHLPKQRRRRLAKI